MKICMISPFSYRAPSSYRLLSFARVLVERGNEIDIIMPSYDRYSNYTIDNGTSTKRVRFLQPFQLKTRKLAINMLSFLTSTAVKSLQRKYDIIHILKPMPTTISGYLPKFFRDASVILDIDDLDHTIMLAEGYSKANVSIMMQCEKIIPHFSDKIVVSCSPLKRLYSDMGLKKDVEIISNGVFIKDFNSRENNNLPEKLSLKDKVIVYLGSLNNEAQLQPLILTMKNIVKRRQDISCLVLGDGIARKDLQQKVVDLNLADSFLFVGRIPHDLVPKYLSLADLGFACFPRDPYYKYASNIKIFEYMAAGVPAIVSPDGDLPYYVDFNKAGFITSSNPVEITEKIDEILSNEKERVRVAQNARLYVKRFDWENLAEKLLKFYKSALK